MADEELEAVIACKFGSEKDKADSADAKCPSGVKQVGEGEKVC